MLAAALVAAVLATPPPPAMLERLLHPERFQQTPAACVLEGKSVAEVSDQPTLTGSPWGAWFARTLIVDTPGSAPDGDTVELTWHAAYEERRRPSFVARVAVPAPLRGQITLTPEFAREDKGWGCAEMSATLSDDALLRVHWSGRFQVHLRLWSGQRLVADRRWLAETVGYYRPEYGGESPTAPASLDLQCSAPLDCADNDTVTLRLGGSPDGEGAFDPPRDASTAAGWRGEAREELLETLRELRVSWPDLLRGTDLKQTTHAWRVLVLSQLVQDRRQQPWREPDPSLASLLRTAADGPVDPVTDPLWRLALASRAAELAPRERPAGPTERAALVIDPAPPRAPRLKDVWIDERRVCCADARARRAPVWVEFPRGQAVEVVARGVDDSSGGEPFTDQARVVLRPGVRYRLSVAEVGDEGPRLSVEPVKGAEPPIRERA